MRTLLNATFAALPKVKVLVASLIGAVSGRFSLLLCSLLASASSMRLSPCMITLISTHQMHQYITMPAATTANHTLSCQPP